AFGPGSSGFASVFVGTYPVYLTVVLAVMIWLETLLMRSRAFPAIHFVEQPPTFTEAFAVQRFQAHVSAFTAMWNYMAAVGLGFWVLFSLVWGKGAGRPESPVSGPGAATVNEHGCLALVGQRGRPGRLPGGRRRPSAGDARRGHRLRTAPPAPPAGPGGRLPGRAAAGAAGRGVPDGLLVVPVHLGPQRAGRDSRHRRAGAHRARRPVAAAEPGP